jgi:hypothetical protein
VSDAISSKNYVNYSSISRCVKERTDSYYLIRLCYGNTCYPSVNMSMNKFGCVLGVAFHPSKDPNSVTGTVSYSSFADNIALDYNYFRFENAGSNYEMKYCNILRNVHTSSSYGLVHVYGNLMIEGSCILENTATYFFWAYSSYTITLSNCTVDKTTNTGSFKIQNTITKSFILGLNHMSTRNCYAEFDLVGTLTAIPFVSNTINKVISCHYQARISDFFSLNWVFMFSFIHPNPS